jgi:hypothetical protein
MSQFVIPETGTHKELMGRQGSYLLVCGKVKLTRSSFVDARETWRLHQVHQTLLESIHETPCP